MTLHDGRFNLRIEPELLVALQALALVEDRSVSAIIRRACWAYVEGQGHGLTRP